MRQATVCLWPRACGSPGRYDWTMPKQGMNGDRHLFEIHPLRGIKNRNRVYGSLVEATRSWYCPPTATSNSGADHGIPISLRAVKWKSSPGDSSSFKDDRLMAPMPVASCSTEQTLPSLASGRQANRLFMVANRGETLRNNMRVDCAEPSAYGATAASCPWWPWTVRREVRLSADAGRRPGPGRGRPCRERE